MFLIWTVVSGLGDLGRIDEFEAAFSGSFGLPAGRDVAEASHLRLPLATFQVTAYWLAGALTKSDAMSEEIRGDTIDVPFQQSWRSFSPPCQRLVTAISRWRNSRCKRQSHIWKAVAWAKC